MNLIFYKTKDETLKKFIEGYYLIKKDNSAHGINYLTFPNNFCVFTVNLGIEKSFSDHKIIIQPSSRKNISSNLIYHYTSPIEIEFKKPVNQITLYFKPFGLNHFIDNLNQFFTNGIIRNFCPFPDFNSKMIEVFNEKDRNEQIEMIEDYWLSKLKNIDLIRERSILFDLENDMSINNLAKKHKLSRQYLNKLFLKYLGKSPSDYYKIHRFRRALATFNNTKNLTELSHMNLFYDQSHFIKEFKSLTHNIPSDFFKYVDLKQNNIWLFK